MRNHYALPGITLLFLLCLLPGFSSAQTLILEESFETDGNGTRYSVSNQFFDGKDDYFGRIFGPSQEFASTGSGQIIDVIGTGGSSTQNGMYTGQNGNFFVAGEDQDDDGGDAVDEKSITFTLDISNASGLTFKGLFAAGNINECTANAYDAADHIKVFYNIDGAGEVEALCFNNDAGCNPDFPTDNSNEPLHHDPNCDNDGGEGAMLTNNFTEYTFAIPDGNMLSLRIESYADSGNEEIAYDWIRVEAQTVVPSCTPVAINCPSSITQVVDENCNSLIPDLTTLTGGILAQSSQEFSGVQGQDGWFYGRHAAFDYSGFTQLPNFTGFVHNNPGTNLDFPQLDANGGHPQIENQFWAVRRWVSDFTGQVQISGDFFDRDGNCGDGAHVRIFQNGTEVFQFLNISISSNPYSLNLNIQAGDDIDFVIDPVFNSSCDDTHFTGVITALTGVTTSDNCNTVTISQSPAPGTAATIGNNPITLTATDGNGNTSTCSVNVTVVDDIPPVALCNDFTVVLDVNGQATISTSQLGTTSDNCTGTGVSASPAFVDCSNLGQVTSTIFISDNAGNTASCNGTITVTDPNNYCCSAADVILPSNAPAIEWPVGFNLNAVPADTPQDPSIDPSIYGSPTVPGDCAAISYQDVLTGPTPGNCPELWVVNRTWTLTFPNGEILQSLQVFTFTDTTSPTIICPPPLTLEWPPNFNLNPVPPNTPQDPSVDPAFTGNPITNDNCGVASVDYQDVLIGPNPNNCPFLWRLDRTWTVTDFCGLTATCVQTLNFTDLTPPTIICPPDLTLEWPPGFNLNPVPPDVPQDPSIDPAITGNPITNDNCGVANVSYQDILIGPDPANCPFLWTVIRTWIVTDFCGLTATCVQIFTFTDLTPPTIICPPDLTLEWPPGFNLNPVPPNVPQDPSISPAVTGNPITNDNCGVANVSYQDILIGPDPVNCPFLWTVIRTWIVTDFCGLTATCVQIFTFTDLTPPTIICPPDLILEWPPGFNLNPVPPNVPQDPSISPAVTGNPITNDNCGVANVSYQDILIGPDPANCPFLWTVIRTWIVTDFCGLTATCVQIFTFTDLTPPTIICPPDLTLEWPPGFNLNPVPPDVPQDPSISPAVTGNPITNDNCGVANVSYQDILIGPDPINCPFLWTVIRTWIVTDFCGLTATCVQIFTFTDTTPPVANCQDVTANIGVTETAMVTASQVNNNSTDNCGIPTLSLSQTTFDCDDIGPNTVILTVTDACNLTHSCTATVTIQDPDGNCCAEPVAMCNNTTAQLDGSGMASVTAQTIGAGSTADCGVASETVMPSSFDCMDIGPNTVTYTITDINGASSSCTAIVAVEDNIAPTAGCVNTTIQLDMNGDGGQTAAAVESGSSDNCSTVNTVSLNPDIFGCADVGTNTVTLTVNDGNGNTATCTASVTVEDNVPPVAKCKDATVTLDGSGNGTLLGTAVDNMSTDACGVASVSVSPAFFGCSDLGGNTVTLEVTDNNGNSATCTATATIEDNIRPSISCPPDAVFPNDPGACEGTFTVPLANASDNCTVTVFRYRWREVDAMGNNITPSWSSWSTDAMQTLDVGFWKIQWQAKDASNNQRKCSFFVDIIDEERPGISCPADAVFPNDPGACEGTFTVPLANASDNCGVTVLRYRWREVDAMGNNITPSWSSWSTDAMQTLDVGFWKIQWQAKDAANNQRKCSFLLEVKDTEPPVPVCLDATVTFNGQASLPVTVAELYDALASTDNCGTVNLVSPTVDQLVDCDRLGEIIDVPVVVNDGNGNDGNCTATITVEGLPCGWTDNGGIACGGSSSDFNSGVSTVDLTAGVCAPIFPYTADATSFVFTELCGDGEIIARVDNIAGGQGFAGVMARDSEAPGSPKVSIGTNTVNRVRKEVRVLPGYPAWPQAVLAYDQFWVRIMRTGPTFRAFASTDGANWFEYIFQNIQMGSCIKVGLYAYNEKATSPITATFSNVSVNGVPVGALDGGAPPALNLGDLGQGMTEQNLQDLNPTITLFPNPTSGELNLDLGGFMGERADIRVFNSMGQQVMTHRIDQIEIPVERMDMSQLKAGMYHVSVKVGDTMITERVVIAR